MLMAAWQFAPAMAAGNSFILKPAKQSSLTAVRMAELAAEAGIPEGVFNGVPGFGPTTGIAIGMHNDIDCVASPVQGMSEKCSWNVRDAPT